jgi:GrpB-like predicted nucleotidyltransferase (UPF0157 family)
MADPIIVVPYDPAWHELFVTTATPMREALGDVAIRIDHVGSTAIPGIVAKPVIDILISIASFEPFDTIENPLASLGYVWQSANPDKTKRFFREPPGTRRTHVHVQKHGSWGQQFVLLFRDYLRSNEDERRRYEAIKQELAAKFRNDRPSYVAGKSPIIWEIMVRASQWVQDTGWEAGSSDL